MEVSRQMIHELDEISASLGRLRYELFRLKVEMKFRRGVDRKAGFDPDQPRDALGMWTDGGGSTSVDERGASDNQVSATFADLASVPFAARFEELLGGNDSNTTGDLFQEIAATITQYTARTGIPAIDESTEKLSADLIQVMNTLDFIPDQTPQAYGIAVHVAFATRVKASDYPGIGEEGVEQSFLFKEVAKYGVAGSIRTDVALRDVAGDVIAIYDLKTGGAVLSASRADELRAQTGALPNTPVIELHFFRGSRLKHEQIAENLRTHSAPHSRNSSVRELSDHQADRLRRARIFSRHHAA